MVHGLKIQLTSISLGSEPAVQNRSDLKIEPPLEPIGNRAPRYQQLQ